MESDFFPMLGLLLAVAFATWLAMTSRIDEDDEDDERDPGECEYAE